MTYFEFIFHIVWGITGYFLLVYPIIIVAPSVQ